MKIIAWSSNGWLDAKQTLYYEHHAHPLKVALAR